MSICSKNIPRVRRKKGQLRKLYKRYQNEEIQRASASITKEDRDRDWHDLEYLGWD